MIDEEFLVRIQPHQRAEAVYRAYHAELVRIFNVDPHYQHLAPYFHYTNTGGRDVRIASNHFSGRASNCLVANWRPALEMFSIKTIVTWERVIHLAEQRGVSVLPLTGGRTLPVNFNFDVNAKGALEFWVDLTLESIRVMENH